MFPLESLQVTFSPFLLAKKPSLYWKLTLGENDTENSADFSAMQAAERSASLSFTSLTKVKLHWWRQLFITYLETMGRKTTIENNMNVYAQQTYEED